eukprot:CAMPEP_0180416774 /NCGR_PEP_ID=MMETSP1036_2-20121128/670_1 /TAXON_ID=632150 /ORGANISM="Azadinium spinosum, Strain 3D9" /LENGTH=293 /DNA_ID=CAMNT_0022421741 /DNA_START=70 /DNA_END=948 /DNA_ORIENTATION=-
MPAAPLPAAQPAAAAIDSGGGHGSVAAHRSAKARAWRARWPILTGAAGLFTLALGLSLLASGPGRGRSAAASEPGGRALQSSEEVGDPTVDEPDNFIFSRPPYSRNKQKMLIYYTFSIAYLVLAVMVVIGINLDKNAQRRRQAKALTPREFVSHQVCCFRCVVSEESVPCTITEQYAMDSRLLFLKNEGEILDRKQRRNFWTYAFQLMFDFFEVFPREHLLVSFLLREIPTFPRVKRALLIATELHLCMLTASLALNIREHEASSGTYQILFCDGSLVTSDCLATLPLSLMTA